MDRLRKGLWIWAVALLACSAVVALAFMRLDMPIARHFWDASRMLKPLGDALGSAILLTGEAAVVVALVVTRLVRGSLPVLGKTLAIACLTSICAYVLNDHVLKVLCGVPDPADTMEGARHAFNLWAGSARGSFPSGHMVLAAGFAGVFMRLHKASLWPMGLLLALGAGLLIVGDWHFASDVIAGTFIGLSAGLLAGEAWAAHSARELPRG